MVTLVYMESGSDGAMSVMEMVPAASPAEWTLPSRARVLVFAFGSQDKRLISQMTQYAEQTSQTEDNLELLSVLENEDDESIGGVDANQSIRPHVGRNCASPKRHQLWFGRIGTSSTCAIVTMKDKVMDGYFFNAGGLFMCGGMLPDVKNWLFPETEFRSVFSVASPDDSMQLCGRFLPTGSGRTRCSPAKPRVLERRAHSFEYEIHAGSAAGGWTFY